MQMIRSNDPNRPLTADENLRAFYPPQHGSQASQGWKVGPFLHEPFFHRFCSAQSSLCPFALQVCLPDRVQDECYSERSVQGLAQGASADGVGYAAGRPLLRPSYPTGFPAGTYARSIARFAAKLPQHVRDYALRRAASSLVAAPSAAPLVRPAPAPTAQRPYMAAPSPVQGAALTTPQAQQVSSGPGSATWPMSAAFSHGLTSVSAAASLAGLNSLLGGGGLGVGRPASSGGHGASPGSIPSSSTLSAVAGAQQ